MLHIPVHVVNGKKDGPVLGIDCTSHGDEAFAILVIKEVIESLNPEELSGTVLGMPVMNPIGFETSHRLTTLRMITNETNLNTAFPGSENGSLVGRMAYQVTKHFLDKLDYLMDYHCGGLEAAIDYTLVKKPDGEYGDRVMELSKAYGSRILSVSKPAGFNGSISEVAAQRGIPAIVPMCGGSSVCSDPEVLRRGVRGVRNVMKVVGMLAGEPELEEDQVVLGDRTLVRHQEGGLFLPAIDYSSLGQTVPKGTLVGRVISPYTFEVLEEIVTPFEPTLLIMIRGLFSRVYPGDYAFIFGDGSSLK
jgi:predicted deacylase